MFDLEDSDSESHHSQAPSAMESHVACDKVLWSARLEIMVRVERIAEALRARLEEPTELDKLRWDEGIACKRWGAIMAMGMERATLIQLAFGTPPRACRMGHSSQSPVQRRHIPKQGRIFHQSVSHSPTQLECWRRLCSEYCHETGQMGTMVEPRVCRQPSRGARVVEQTHWENLFKTALVGARDADEALNNIGQGITATWEAIVQYVDMSPPEGSASSRRSSELSEYVGIFVD
ncbi:hypothetical protein C8Q80DRAFT_1190828 [Daedaleopsis nitida]|nr:hypothetical protein C8Q80DRAFT_1190828 [Daedaleopsis nitida]